MIKNADLLTDCGDPVSIGFFIRMWHNKFSGVRYRWDVSDHIDGGCMRLGGCGRR